RIPSTGSSAPCSRDSCPSAAATPSPTTSEIERARRSPGPQPAAQVRAAGGGDPRLLGAAAGPAAEARRSLRGLLVRREEPRPGGGAPHQPPPPLRSLPAVAGGARSLAWHVCP